MEKRDELVLLALALTPLDRIHLMKVLFLYCKEEPLPPFHFVPYLYGPCSFEVYSSLERLSKAGLIRQADGVDGRRAPFHATAKGRAVAARILDKIPQARVQRLKALVQELSNLNFHDLLSKVYAEAPEFAINSVVRTALPR